MRACEAWYNILSLTQAMPFQMTILKPPMSGSPHPLVLPQLVFVSCMVIYCDVIKDFYSPANADQGIMGLTALVTTAGRGFAETTQPNCSV